MIKYKPKTRAGEYKYEAVEDLIPILHRCAKSFKRVSPSLNLKLEAILSNPPQSITSTSRLIDHIQNNIFCLQRGAHTPEELQEILGWNEEEINEHLKGNHKRQIQGYRDKYGTKTCLNKEYWIIQGMSEAEAIAKVSAIQTENSNRVPKEQKRQNLKNVIDGIHYEGMSLEEATSKLSAHQREQSKRCTEHFVKRGNTDEEAKAQVSRYQEQQTKFHPAYWVKRGFSEEESQERSVQAAIANFKINTRTSAQSQSLFNKIADFLPARTFLYGENEQPFSASKLGKNRRCYFLDFYEPATKLCIEFDGKFWHCENKERDAERDKFLFEEYGIKTLRICSSMKPKDAINNILTFLELK